MRRPSRYTTVPCGYCGAQRRVLNGAWLRWKRERAGIGLRAFGREYGVKHSALSEIERNQRACPAEVLDAYEQLEVT